MKAKKQLVQNLKNYFICRISAKKLKEILSNITLFSFMAQIILILNKTRLKVKSKFNKKWLEFFSILQALKFMHQASSCIETILGNGFDPLTSFYQNQQPNVSYQ